VRGGSTLSTVWTFINKDGERVIHSANVGDSDIILVKQDKQTRVVSYEHLSTDHGASNQDEYVRIQLDTKYMQKLLQCYKQCDPCDKKKFHYPRIFTPLPTIRLGEQFSDMHVEKFVRNPWGKNLTPATVRYDPSAYATSPPGARDGVQIAMVRMIGDFNAQQYGAISKPSNRTIVVDTDKCDHLLFNGSDGVWDCWKYEEFAEEAMRQNATSTLTQCIDNLFTLTVNKAKTLFGQKGFDDVTLTGIRF
jgi:serine/threonine protein phosphatase PrpC